MATPQPVLIVTVCEQCQMAGASMLSILHARRAEYRVGDIPTPTDEENGVMWLHKMRARGHVSFTLMVLPVPLDQPDEIEATDQAV